MSEKETKKTFKPGEDLVKEGDKGDCAYIVESGNVEILVKRNGQMVQIGSRGPGSIIGEMAMIDDQPRTATVRAIDECEVLEITRNDFARRIDRLDPVLKMVMHVILTRYRDMLGRSAQFTAITKKNRAEALERSVTSDEAMNTIKVHNELKKALDNDELTLFYQPMIDLQSGRIAGFEALMRWIHPEKGMISPGIFIPVAEENGLIVPMTRWAMETGCAAIKDIQKQAPKKSVTKDPLFMSINFSVKDFAEPDFFDFVQKTMKKTKVTPDRLHLEITESLLVEQPDVAKAALEKCRDEGLCVSIDDFGTGYSSLSYLHYFPIQALKIDQSFIRSMLAQENSFVLVKSIIGLAKNLNMKVIAEGIESREEGAAVRDLGCDLCQGFWFSKPIPKDEVIEFVKEWDPPEISRRRTA